MSQLPTHPVLTNCEYLYWFQCQKRVKSKCIIACRVLVHLVLIYFISFLSGLLLLHHHLGHTSATSSSFWSPGHRALECLCALYTLPSACNALSSLPCWRTFMLHSMCSSNVLFSCLHGPLSMHPLKHIALCQVCLPPIRPSFLNQRWFCPQGTFDSIWRHFLIVTTKSEAWKGGATGI